VNTIPIQNSWYARLGPLNWRHPQLRFTITRPTHPQPALLIHGSPRHESFLWSVAIAAEESPSMARSNWASIPLIMSHSNFLRCYGYSRNTLEKFEPKPKPFDMIWHRFCLGLNSPDRPDLVPPYLPHLTISSLGIALATKKRLYKEFFGKICTFGCSASVWTRAEANVHVFDLFWRARARPGAWPRAPMPSDDQPHTLACAHAYKAARGHDHTPPHALSPARAQVHRSSLYARRVSGRPSPPTVDQPLQPTSIQSSSSASLTSHEAPRALWLSSTAVSRLEHAPSTSPTACARGQPSFGHHLWRFAPRRDRQRPPDLTRPFAGLLPSPVSHTTAFPLLGYCSG
jgi:hypothetical protein